MNKLWKNFAKVTMLVGLVIPVLSSSVINQQTVQAKSTKIIKDPKEAEKTVTADCKATNLEGGDLLAVTRPFFDKTIKATQKDDGTFDVEYKMIVDHSEGMGRLTGSVSLVDDKIGDYPVKITKETKDKIDNFIVEFNMKSLNPLKKGLAAKLLIKTSNGGTLPIQPDFMISSDIADKFSGDNSGNNPKEDNPKEDTPKVKKATDSQITELNQYIRQVQNMIDSGAYSDSQIKEFKQAIVDAKKALEKNTYDDVKNAIGDLKKLIDKKYDDTNDSEKDVSVINYEVLKEDGKSESIASQYFTKRADVEKQSDGTFKISLTVATPTNLGKYPVKFLKINNSTIKDSDNIEGKDEKDNYTVKTSFNVDKLTVLQNNVPVQLKVDVASYGIHMTPTAVLKFDLDSASDDEDINDDIFDDSDVNDDIDNNTDGSNGGGSYGSMPENNGSTRTKTPERLPQTGNNLLISQISTIVGIVLVAGLVLITNSKRKNS